MHRIQVYGLLISIFIFALILELVRRRKIREEYSLLWIFTATILLIIGIFPKLVEKISELTQTYYLTTVALVGFSFLFFIVLHFSIVISRLSERTQTLMQQIALLEYKIRQLTENKNDKKN